MSSFCAVSRSWLESFFRRLRMLSVSSGTVAAFFASSESCALSHMRRRMSSGEKSF